MSTADENEFPQSEATVAHTAIVDHVAIKSFVQTKTKAEINTDHVNKLVTLMETLGISSRSNDRPVQDSSFVFRQYAKTNR